jgi:hypothetical protein
VPNTLLMSGPGKYDPMTLGIEQNLEQTTEEITLFQLQWRLN